MTSLSLAGTERNTMKQNIDRVLNHEAIKHGTIMLPYSIYRTYIPRVFTDFPMHWHEEIEIIYVMSGKAIYTVDFEQYILEEGDILIIPPAALHSFKQYESCDFFAYSILFDQKMVDGNAVDTCSKKFISPIFKNEIYLPIHINSSNEHNNAIRTILNKAISSHTDMNFGYELEIKITFLEFINFFYKHNYYNARTKNNDINTRTANLIKGVTTFIEEHYKDKITLEILAEHANISVYHLSHIFKQSTGQTPIEYLNQYRLIMSADMLKSSDYSIMQIAFECGYNNVSYFNRAFKAKYGITPKEYRK